MARSTSSIRVKMRYREKVKVITVNDGDLVTINDDGDLKSVIEGEERSNLTFHLDVEKRQCTKHDWTLSHSNSSASSSSCSTRGTIPPEQETRGKVPCRHYNFGKGHCRYGSDCKFAHGRNGGESRGKSTERNSSNQRGAAPRAPRIVTNFELWLRQQYERRPTENIAFLSRDDGFGVLAKIVDKKNLPVLWIELVVKLLTRKEFRLSLMRENTNKIYGILLGSPFLLQLHGHITRQLAKAKAEDIMPYLVLIEELQSRTTHGWKEVPLDAINNVVQKLEGSCAKTELLMIVNRLIDHSNKLHRQAALFPSDEYRFLGREFRSISIFPDKGELLQPHLGDVPLNLVGRRYTSLPNYLETHFRLLREDCIDPIRQGLKAYRNERFSRDLHIYQQVRLAGYRCGHEGVEHVVNVSIRFQDTRIDLEGSKRLMFGALVCLSLDAFQNSFIFGVVTGKDLKGRGAARCTVRIRLVGNSELVGEAPIASGRSYVMVESTTAYFEAYYHVLKCLQMEDMENLPFTKYLLDFQQEVGPPSYLQRRAKGDEFGFEGVFPSIKAHTGKSTIRVLQHWPRWPSTLDGAQLQALKHGLTKELSIIQGPPGTGKTFLGLLLVRLLLANFKAEVGCSNALNFRLRRRLNALSKTSTDGRKGPILVICMTNHALDQFLEGIFKFESKVVRIGGRSKSKVLQERTLRSLLQVEKEKRRELFVGQREAKGTAWGIRTFLEEEIHECVTNLNAILVKREELTYVATDEQIRNLFSVDFNSKEVLQCWLAGDVVPCLAEPHLGGYQHPFRPDPESIEEVYAELKEGSRRGKVIMLKDAEYDDGWQSQGRRRGNRRRQQEDVNVAAPLPVKVIEDDHQLINEFQAMAIRQDINIMREDDELPDVELDDHNELQIEHFVDFPEVWRLNQDQRRILHQYWLQEVKMKYRRQFQELTKQYVEACKLVRQVDDEINLSLLRKANVVGITTTTAARFHDILKALNSEILIVEEAAEVLEGHIVASLSSNVKHLVLIGDHLQLRPSTAVYQLGTKHKLDVSMFERLVEGGVDHVVLQEQRRMRPSFSKLVRSLYPKLKDHESVSKFEDIKGVTSNLLFFDHTAEENSSTVDSSKLNTTEAKLVVELTLYLMQQECYSAKNIAVLTMYSGQLMEIKRLLQERAARTLSPKYFERMRKMQNEEYSYLGEIGKKSQNQDKDDDIGKFLPRVSSVDDFQGEEAEIIILSLVRSNDIQTGEGEGTIGFLKTSNRICVALTRAKKGMYIFGNATLLAKRSSMWSNVITTLRKDNALDTKLELVCQNHPETKTTVTKEGDFKQVADGGCSRPCEVQLECGHVCPRRCHPGSHDDVVCPIPCLRKYSDCHHTCTQACHGSSDCPPCKVRVMKVIPTCGHTQRMNCCSDPADETCRNPCPRIIECLHKCAEVCGLPCTAKCIREVAKDLPCGHTCEIPCHEDPNSYSCTEPCRTILHDCEHQCQGNCGRCQNGTEHIPCLQKCGIILPCGHACQHGCSSVCSPCMKQCEKRCFHSKCQLLCGEICVPCREPCPWQCMHHKCDLLCHEICTRPRCDLPCKRIMSCGHPCIGLCGEPCPTKCRTCHPQTIDIITQMRLDESGQTDLFIQLQDCKHLFEVTGLDTWMDSDDTQDDNGRKSAAVKLKECPQCKSPVWRSTRYGNVVKTKQLKLEEVKKIFGYERTR